MGDSIQSQVAKQVSLVCACSGKIAGDPVRVRNDPVRARGE